MDMDLAWCPVCEKQILPELITIVRPRVASAHPKPIIPEYPAPQQQPTQAAVDPVMQAPPPTPVVRKVAFAANPVTQTRRATGGHGLVHGTGRGPAVRATVAARKKQAQIAQAALLAQQQLLIAQQQQQAQAAQAAARAAAMEPEVVTEFSSAPPPLYCSEACREKDLDNTSFVFPSTSPPTAFRRLSSGSESEGSSGKLQSSSSESSLYEHGGVGATRQFMQRIPSSASVASSSAATASSGRSSSGGFINDPLNFTRTKQRARKALQMTTSSFTAVPCVKGLTVDERWKRKEEEQDKEMARWKIERLRRECDELNLGCDEVPAPVAEVKPIKATTTTRARKPSRPALLLSSSPSAASTSTSTVDVLSRTSSCQSIAVNGVSPEDRSPIYGTVPRKPRRAASTTSSSTRSRSPSSPLATTSPTTPTSDADSISAFKRDPNHDAWSWEDAKDKSTLLYDVDPAMLTCFDNKRLWNFTREKMGVWKRPEGEEGLKTLVGAGEVREEKPVGWGKMGLGRNSTSSSAWLRSH